MRRSFGLSCTLTFALTIALWGPLAALAADGRFELSHAGILAAGGYPFTITQPGSYVLTSDLDVPAATTGLIIKAPDVTLDLNGFTIEGSHACSLGGCSAGAEFGIFALGVQVVRTVVRNGSVRGFGAACVFVFRDSHVSDLGVSSCGLTGIAAGDGSLVERNRVHDVGGKGLQLSDGAAFGMNTVGSTSLVDTTAPAVANGTPVAGNDCVGPACRNRRRFYLSKTDRTGATAPSACAHGFHMASLPELIASGSLAYDPVLGKTAIDSGAGMPIGLLFLGWARTGSVSSATSCNAYTSTSGTGKAAFPTLLETPDVSTDIVEIQWRTVSANCTNTDPVWCVED